MDTSTDFFVEVGSDRCPKKSQYAWQEKFITLQYPNALGRAKTYEIMYRGAESRLQEHYRKIQGRGLVETHGPCRPFTAKLFSCRSLLTQQQFYAELLRMEREHGLRPLVAEEKLQLDFFYKSIIDDGPTVACGTVFEEGRDHLFMAAVYRWKPYPDSYEVLDLYIDKFPYEKMKDIRLPFVALGENPLGDAEWEEETKKILII